MSNPTQQNIHALFQRLYNRGQEVKKEKEEDKKEKKTYDNCDAWHLLHGLNGPGSESRCDDKRILEMMEEKENKSDD